MDVNSGKPERGRRFTADEKVRILEETPQPGTTVAEVLRRYDPEGTTFCRWEWGGQGGDARGACRQTAGAPMRPAP